MPISIDIRYAIASLTAFVDHWLHRPEFAHSLTLRELHAARVVLAKARLALDECDTSPPGLDLEPPDGFAPASLAHRMHARAEARHQVALRPAPRMPHP